MVKKALSVFNYVIFLLLGVLFLWLVFRKQDPQDIIDSIVNADYLWIMLGIVAGILSHIARAARWNILIRSLGYKPRLTTTFYAVMTGYLANTAVPRLGEVTRCGVLSKKQNIPFTEVLGTMIAERIFDMIVLILIIIMVIAFQWQLVGSFMNEKIIAPVSSNFENNILNIVLIIGLLVFLIVLMVVLWKKYRKYLQRYAIFRKFSEFAKGMVEGIKTIKKTKNKAGFLLYTIIIWGMYTLMIYLPFYALEATSHLNFVDALTVMSIGSLGIVAPVPGGIGTYHWIVKAVLFELYGISPMIAASFATITHAAQTVMIIVVGGLSFLMLFLQKNKSENEPS